jgi:hypothetical protein
MAISADPSASAVETLVEAFDNPLSGWKTRFLGVNSNLRNYYVQYNNCWVVPAPEEEEDCRGNNLDGLWIADDNNDDGNSDIRFVPAFAATLTSLELDIGSHTSAKLKIYDKDMNVLLDEAIPLGCSNCSYSGTPQVYSHHAVRSTNGIGGFDIIDADLTNDQAVEGNVGIDNVTVTQETANETTQRVPAGEAATVAVEEECASDPDGKCAVAGIDIPTGTFNEDVTVTVRLEKLDAGETCHDYLIGQTKECLEITAKRADGTDAPINAGVRPIVGLCLPEHLAVEMFKFEDRQGRAVPLEQTGASFLNCAEFELADAAARNWLEGLAVGVAKRVGRWLTPKPLYAADRGFGGFLDDGHLSFFTWAPAIQVAGAGLAVNLFNSGKDVYTVWGTFGLEAKDFDPGLGEVGFDPARDAVIVGYGKKVHTIGVNSFKWSTFLKRYVYAAKVTGSGITAMEINPVDGKFLVVGTTKPSEGAADPTYRPFDLRIGQRARGAGLECGTNKNKYKCVLQH